MQLIIGNTNFTSALQESTYTVDRVKKFTSWTNANNVEKHGNVHYKIEGSFDMVFLPYYSMNYEDFLEVVESNTINDVITLTLSVNNLDGASRTINCFLDINFRPMRDMKNGTIVKRCTCKVREC